MSSALAARVAWRIRNVHSAIAAPGSQGVPLLSVAAEEVGAHVALVLRDVGPAFLEDVVGEDEIAGERVANPRRPGGEESTVPRIGNADDELRVVVALGKTGLLKGRRRSASGNEGRPIARDEQWLGLERVAGVGEVAVDLDACDRWRGGVRVVGVERARAGRRKAAAGQAPGVDVRIARGGEVGDLVAVDPLRPQGVFPCRQVGGTSLDRGVTGSRREGRTCERRGQDGSLRQQWVPPFKLRTI